MLEEILELIEAQHGELNFKDGEDYFLFIEGAVINISYDEEVEALIVDVTETNPEKTYVYFNPVVTLEELMEEGFAFDDHEEE